MKAAPFSTTMEEKETFMARTTDPALRNSTVYSVFIRNHSPSGDLAGLSADLGRISELGCDILWLLPIHPIGQLNRKGSDGSPYAISDYRGINPEYGDMDSFADFLRRAHEKNFRVIIDVVFNHTSPDSLLRQVHPEWFWKNSDGDFGNRVDEWSDIIDLDYASPDLWDYQIETLKGWVREGVDGFRCDVASLLPLSFWLEARDACAVANPDTIWIAETVEGDFINLMRRSGYDCLTDTEALRAFDLSYEYDLFPDWIRLLDGNIGLDAYLDRLRNQEATLSDTDLKLRFLENHDQRRAADLLDEPGTLRQWTAYSLFAKGTALVYAGQEYAIRHRPDLFETDPVDWSLSESETASDHWEFLKSLISLKKEGIVRDGFYWLPEAPRGCIVGAYERRSPDGRLTGLRVGIFNVEEQHDAEVNCRALWPELEDETAFVDRISGKEIQLTGGRLQAGVSPMILDWGLTS